MAKDEWHYHKNFWGGDAFSRARRRRVITTALIESGGDVKAVAKDFSTSEQTIQKYLGAGGLREKLEALCEAEAAPSYAEALSVLKQGMHAERQIVSVKTGEVIDTVADHPTRVAAAGKFLGLMAGLAKAERPPELEDERRQDQPETRGLTREEFMALTEAGRLRVTMERTRMVVEPSENQGGVVDVTVRE